MRQILYVSESLIGRDVRALDQVMVEARTNNSIDGLTGLLWTDGRRFAQVLEGDDRAITLLLPKLRLDGRHKNLEVVRDVEVQERQFGEWAMSRPTNDKLFAMYEQRMRVHLAWLRTEISAVFDGVIAGSGTVATN